MKTKNFEKKIVSFDEIDEISRSIREENKTIVTSNGCFDILHMGHIKYLQTASEFGDFLIVGINSDSSVKEIKGKKRPVNSEIDRASIVASFGFVDYCVIFSQDTPVELLGIIKPRVHVKGGDYNISEIVEKKTVEDEGGTVKIIPVTTGYSTTEILNNLRREKD